MFPMFFPDAAPMSQRRLQGLRHDLRFHQLHRRGQGAVKDAATQGAGLAMAISAKKTRMAWRCEELFMFINF